MGRKRADSNTKGMLERAWKELSTECLWETELGCIFWWRESWDGQFLLAWSRWPKVENAGRTEGNEKGELERSFPSFCLSACHESVTEGRVFEHARRIGRGRGWWRNGSIGVGMIHHGDWRCLCMGSVGFVLDKYHGSCMRVTKLL